MGEVLKERLLEVQEIVKALLAKGTYSASVLIDVPESKLVDLLMSSPSVPLDLPLGVLALLLENATLWKADKISYHETTNGYRALLFRKTPRWLTWLAPYYPRGVDIASFTTIRIVFQSVEQADEEDDE